jgi:hypothetical protein
VKKGGDPGEKKILVLKPHFPSDLPDFFADPEGVFLLELQRLPAVGIPVLQVLDILEKPVFQFVRIFFNKMIYAHRFHGHGFILFAYSEKNVNPSFKQNQGSGVFYKKRGLYTRIISPFVTWR